MALIVEINTDSPLGDITAAAIQQIRDGFGTLRKYDGMRAQCIGVSAIYFGEQFGIADATQAQAMSDRWGAIAARTYTGLDDFLDATISGPA